MNRVHPKDYRVISESLRALDCARSLTVFILFKYGQFDDIVNLTFDPLDYNSLEDASDALQSTELLRKCDNLPTTIDRKAVALKNFFDCEEKCSHVNNVLIDSVDPGLMLRIRRKIADCLGDFTPEEFVELSGWGPGVTLTLSGQNANLFNKFSHDGESTPLCASLLKPWFHLVFPTWQVNPRIYEGNKVITVPKNAKTDRVIAVEPSLNLYFQKGVGAMIRSRLLRSGIDLRDQGHNQRLCRLASKYNQLATVDFSSASDTISYSVVLELLPYRWFLLMDALRSPRGVVGNSIIEYNKFSSMGNGYTFELESLIFWAIAKCVVPKNHPLYSKISVFGDDLVIPSDYIKECTAVFSAFGFTINSKKSYSSTYYRESCGKHYWNGCDITPFYIRSLSLTKDLEVFKLHNQVIRYASRLGSGICKDIRFKGVCSLLRSYAAKPCFIPDGFGDGGFVCEFDECRPAFARRYQSGWYTYHYSFEPNHFWSDKHSVLLTRLYAPSVDLSLGNLCPYPRRGVYRKKSLYVPQWSYLGPWSETRVPK